LDVQGPLIDVFESGDRLLTIHYPAAEKLRLARWLWSIPAPKYLRSGIFSGFPRRFTPSAARIRDAVNYHYNHPVDFWKLWLDESLCYSCAYFEAPEVSLADAQKNKLDCICRKLRLRPGQRLLDMGCGWGALVMHAAANSAYEFRCGHLNIYQTLLTKPVHGQSGLPLTRADWYQSSQAD
jgi:cyclopropane-fatty-acyl-phospholipid synthase